MFSGTLFPHWRRKAAERSSSSSYEVPFFLNAAYYPNWRIYRKQPPSSLRLGFISHIFYAFAWYPPSPRPSPSLPTCTMLTIAKQGQRRRHRLCIPPLPSSHIVGNTNEIEK